MKERQNRAAQTIRSFWRRCDKNPAFASILKDILDGKAAGRVLLVAVPELFSTVVHKGSPFPHVFRSRGLPYWSHRSFAVSKGLEEVAAHQAAEMRKIQQVTGRRVQAVQEVTRDEFRDQLVIAVLKTIQGNSDLRTLVTNTETITKSSLRRVVKDYSAFTGKEFEELLAFIPGFLLRPKQKAAINRLTLDLDPLVGSIEPDHLRRWMTGQTIERFLHLLRERRVSEDSWRDLLMELLDGELVGPSVPLYLWCRRCPGVGFMVSSMPLDCTLPPRCPSYGWVAQAISAYAPTGLLREAMEPTDGLLGAAVGWVLHTQKLMPQPARIVDGRECDFLFKSASVGKKTFLECKMHHVLSPRENIRDRLLESKKQLCDHIHGALDRKVHLSRAACVVNLSAAQLRRAMKGTPPETDSEFLRVDAQLLSYENLRVWLGA